MQQIQVQGIVTTEWEPKVVVGFMDDSTGHTIVLTAEETEKLSLALTRSLADAWDLVKAEAAGDTTPPILPSNADVGSCCNTGTCQLTPAELDAVIADGNVPGITSTPITDEEAIQKANRLSDPVREDGFDSEDARSC